MNINTEIGAKLRETADFIRARTDIVPEAAIILGSGLGRLAESSEGDAVFSYHELPNFAMPTVPGHAGRLMIGSFADRPVAVMQGRFHYYEGYAMEEVIYPVRFLKLLGAKCLIITSACGALNASLKPHDIVLLRDHINFMGASFFRGPHSGEFGERFPDMGEVYDKILRRKARSVAARARIKVKEGIYTAVCGPSYETPAEVRAYRKLGGDVVGMSVAPEAAAAHQMGMKVLGITYVSNAAGRMGSGPLSHADVIKAGSAVTKKIGRIIAGVLSGL